MAAVDWNKRVKQILKLHEDEILKLDIGCGYIKEKGEGWIGMDMTPYDGVDVVWNIETQPWPFPDQTFALLSASHVIEHINPLDHGMIRFMDECWRVLKYDGQFRIACPSAGSAGYWGDPEHVNPVIPRTFSYFDPLYPGNTYEVYEPKPWKIQQMYWAPEGNIEALISKRRDDPSYHRNVPRKQKV